MFSLLMTFPQLALFEQVSVMLFELQCCQVKQVKTTDAGLEYLPATAGFLMIFLILISEQSLKLQDGIFL